MAMNADRRAAIARRLAERRIDGRADEPITIMVKRRELAFLLDAVDHFRREQCSVDDHSPDCSLVYWYETPEGHIERACERFCDQLMETLVAQVPEND